MKQIFQIETKKKLKAYQIQEALDYYFVWKIADHIEVKELKCHPHDIANMERFNKEV